MRYMVALAGVIPSLVNVCSINYIDGKVYLILADYQWISSFTDVPIPSNSKISTDKF